MMNLRTTRSPLQFFVALFLLALLPLSIIIVNIARASVPLAVPSAPSTAGDWPMYGHDQSRTNYNPDETTISAANVNQLVSRWQQNVFMGPTATSSSPSVVAPPATTSSHLTRSREDRPGPPTLATITLASTSASARLLPFRATSS